MEVWYGKCVGNQRGRVYTLDIIAHDEAQSAWSKAQSSKLKVESAEDRFL